jgi:hypothetical protein
VLGIIVAGLVLGEAAILGPDQFAWRLLCVVAFVPLLLVTRIVSVRELSTLGSVLSGGRIGR